MLKTNIIHNQEQLKIVYNLKLIKTYIFQAVENRAQEPKVKIQS